LHAAVTLQQHALGVEIASPRLQTACGIFLEHEAKVRGYLFPRGSSGGRIVLTEPAYDALGGPLQEAYEWRPPERARWGRGEHSPRACFWDERFTLLNPPFESAFSVETTRWVGPRREASKNKRKPLPYPERPDVRNELVGLGLGGGGMRAAVFSLGVTQAMARNDFLEDVDYMATVSGGGYLGTSLQSLMAEDLPYKDPGRFGMTAQTFPFAFPRPADASGGTATSTGHGVHGIESPATRYVREHARFLGRWIGLFDGYTWRMVGQVAVSMVLLWVLLLVPPMALAAIGAMAFRDWFEDLSAESQRGLVISPLVVAAVAWAVTVFSPSWWRSFWLWLGRIVVLASVVVAALVVLAVVSTPSDRTSFSDAARTVAALSPLILFGIAAVAVLGFEALRSAADKPSSQERWSATSQRTASYFALLAGAITAILGVVFLVWLIEHTAYDSDFTQEARTSIAVLQVGGLAITFASIQRLVSGMGDAATGRVRSLIPKLALLVGGYLVLGITIALCSWGLWWLWTHQEWPWITAIGLISAVLFLLFGMFGGWGFRALNWLAPHRLYAGLIEQSWIIGAKPAKADSKGGTRLRQWFRVWTRPDLQLSSLRSMDGRKLTAPYPLLCTTLNIPGTRDPRMPDRTCESFVLGPLTSGSALTRWLPTDRYRPADRMALAGAAAISGAAVSPGLGFGANRTLSVVLTLFNVRLGQWLENPRRSGRGLVRSFLNSRPLALYWKEMLGLAQHDDGHVYLSDGEHFEGLGLYELLRRRCKYIVAVAADIEGTKEMPLKFGKLGGALRLARVDFGVEVEFVSLAPLMRDAMAPDFVGSYFAAGVVRYPHADGHGHIGDGDTG
ncbi:MAG: patatin-like phospholipase family protein, partial [Dehalococcoidia bacterium]